MMRNKNVVSSCIFAAVSCASLSAFAIADPNDPNAQVQVQQQPVQQQQQPVMVEQPAPRLGVWGQARAIGGVQFGPGIQGTSALELGIGYIQPSGVSYTGYLDLGYIFGPFAGYNGRIGGLLRYTAMPQVRLHPVGEIGLEAELTLGNNFLDLGASVTLGAGIELDLTNSLSLDIMARGHIGYMFTSRSVPNFIFGRIEPMIGLTLYF
ncbi:MAG: hypothetical protein Q8Q09_00950 [Deltaproteobacteria bacterium]|nr:hypothetical protein [Deltaproteobacteria bacterium]